MKQLLSFLIIWILLLSCSKKREDDKEVPVVTITSPVNNQVFPVGETIQIQGNISDNQYIKEVHIEINNLATDAEYLHVHIIPGSKTYAINQPLTLQSGISYKIKVSAEDPSANTFSQQINISCN